MGGKAFHLLPDNSFPRIPPNVYCALKMRLLPRIQSLYSNVAVPFEAPEKPDHGDLDFIVAVPKTGQGNDSVVVNVLHEEVKQVLGAKYFIPAEGNRTSNFAVPIEKGEWGDLGHAKEEEERRIEVIENEGEIYIQVDVHVCADEAEWKRVVFFHAYGDLGMILGLIARNNGLALSTKGLKLYDPPNPSFELSDDFGAITDFMGLSMDTWNAGFKTKQEVFEWAGSTRFFHPRRFKTEGRGVRKVKVDRTMYAEFVEWANRQGTLEGTVVREIGQEENKKSMDEALVYFGKKEEFDALVRARLARVRLKEGFSGHNVRKWAQLGEYWKGVKMIMDGVRERLGGDEGVLELLDDEGEEGVRKIVLEIKNELGLVSRNNLDAGRELEGVGGKIQLAIDNVVV